MNSHIKHVGLELSQSDLYPPLLHTGATPVGFDTQVPVEFEFNLNGRFGEFPGISLHVGPSGGALFFTRAFIESYSEGWPARLEVQAYQDGQMADSAVLLLHDTRGMVVQRVETSLHPDTASVPVFDDLLVQARPVFYDATDIRLPLEEVVWELLPEPVQGVTVDGALLRISPDAPVGEFDVTFRERSGVEQTIAMTLLPKRDIGVYLQPTDLYPPCRHPGFTVMRVRSEDPDGFSIQVELNGESGRHDGMTLQEIQGEWGIFLTQEFIARYQGAWPIVVTARAIQNGQVVGFASGRLHDTRSMVCTRVDMELHPAERMPIPQQGQITVIAAPRFYDENDIRLPHTELDWGARMIDPIEGAYMDKHLVFIDSSAKPGSYRIALLGPNGLSKTRVLELY